ncbi:hypothetical protein [Aureliella helgolandensis]|uniref:Uncharacterized protein n=1 Tax=Aureliella helgolandensis TaxID=2527968 RepID=A0A518G8J1_9BACT|nr:hypothetical protein [Aureliella helgolandensis]QDV24900.1 hypothetical protein Q31a_32220 [Aureliella helgolandensis]
MQQSVANGSFAGGGFLFGNSPRTGRCLMLLPILLCSLVGSIRGQEQLKDEAAAVSDDVPAAEIGEHPAEPMVADDAVPLAAEAEGMVAPLAVIEPAEVQVEDVINEFQAPGDVRIQLLLNYVSVQAGLARRTCELSDQQELRLKEIDQAWLAKELQQLERRDVPARGIIGGIARFLGGQAVQPEIQAQQPAEPSEQIPLVFKRIDAEFEGILDETQFAEFRQECDAREQFRREAAAELMVTVLDQHLYLSFDQRAALKEGIAKWGGGQDYYWGFYFQNLQYIPVVPDRVVSPLLTREQKNRLGALQRWDYSRIDLQVQGGDIPPVPFDE